MVGKKGEAPKRKIPRLVDSSKLEFPRRANARDNVLGGTRVACHRVEPVSPRWDPDYDLRWLVSELAIFRTSGTTGHAGARSATICTRPYLSPHCGTPSSAARVAQNAHTHYDGTLPGPRQASCLFCTARIVTNKHSPPKARTFPRSGNIPRRRKKHRAAPR
jgi:hypothetical protein